MNELVAPPTHSVAAAEPIVFSGIRGDFRRLVLHGALLELVTLGFYRFWLATNMRRHLWSHTEAGGDALEYTGTGKELLVGFLFALAILVPIYFVYFLIGVQAEDLQAFASIPLVLFFYVFAQFAMYRARRYRLTRTIWRGVRFWMTGSGWSYAWRSALWGLFAVITLGIALPWRAAALERFKMRHSFYGDLQGRFDSTGWQLFKRIWWIWLGVLLVLVFVHAVRDVAPAAGVVVAVIAVVALLFSYPIYKAIEWRWWASGIRFGEVRFESNLGAGRLIGLYVKVLAWFLLLIAAFFAVIFVVTFLVAGTMSLAGLTPETLLAQQTPILVLSVLAYVVAALGLSAIIRIYLVHDIWARVATSASVYNLTAAHNVVAKGDAASALGEGLADSLDVGGM